MSDPHPPSGQRPSTWMESQELPSLTPLYGDIDTDVCVIGAGIAGLTTAYLLLKAGRSVAVLDDGPVGGGASSMTSAHLSSAIDDTYTEIEHLHGSEGARLVAQSHAAAIEQIAAIAAAEGIDCDFAWLDGYLVLAPDTPVKVLDAELRAARRAGVVGIEGLPEGPLGGWGAAPCLRYPRQARFHPLKYLVGLAAAVQRLGGRVFTGTHADEVVGGTPCRVQAGAHTIEADDVVVATNSPVNDRVAIHTKQAGYMTYVLAARIPHGAVPDALYWDTGTPYHYVRLQPAAPGSGDDDLLIVGGEDHKTGQDEDTEAHHERLEAWARKQFPAIRTIESRWSGQVLETIDGIAFIGRNPLDSDNVWVITGDSGMGLTHGTLGGMLLRDLITGQPNPWAELYDPSRKTLKAAGTYLREAANMAVQYADWVTEGEVDSAAFVPSGEGAVVRRGLKKVACYRNPEGHMHECSAVCPHLGGIVRWNMSEQTWDCPCHGSRFDRFGVVISGPANQNLAGSPAEPGVVEEQEVP